MNEGTTAKDSGMQKKVIVIGLAAVAIVALAVAVSRPGGELPVAPGVRMKDLAGNDVTLEQFRGQVVLVNFWATWCSPCQIEMPWFIAFQEKYGPRGLKVIGVAMDEEGKQVVEPFLQKEEFDVDGRKMKVNYKIVLGDDALAEKFGGLIGLPTTLVIDRNGRIVKRFIGLVSHDLIVKEIEGLL